MPNTLVHLAVQGLSSKPFMRPGDLRWLALGTVLPDLPWVAQRLARALPDFDWVALRAYCVAQSSFLVTLLLCSGLAAFARRPGRAFGWLASASLVHLLLDAVQHKWGNAVLLFAPFSWGTVEGGWIWPEHPLIAVLSVLGMAAAVRLNRGEPAPNFVWPARRLPLAAVLMAAYALVPLWMGAGAISANLHYMAVLSPAADRAGEAIAFDRVRYEVDEAGRGQVHSWSGETFAASGGPSERRATLSLKGRFLDSKTIEITVYHRHFPFARQGASLIGLALIAWIWSPIRIGRRSRQEGLHSAPT